ncbi:hypothetical protein [Streptococcus parauberis]|uniref:hypothetical protein n=1 Tax=Streptococcus parauberis TaxID=1348 RepID=UPI0039B0C3E6
MNKLVTEATKIAAKKTLKTAVKSNAAKIGTNFAIGVMETGTKALKEYRDNNFTK